MFSPITAVSSFEWSFSPSLVSIRETMAKGGGVSKKMKRLYSCSSSFSISRDTRGENTKRDIWCNTNADGTKDQKMRLERRRFSSSLHLFKRERTLLLYATYKFSTMRLCTLGSLKSCSICAFVRLLLCPSSSSSSSSAKIRAVRNLSSILEDCGADFPPSFPPEGFDLRERRRRPIITSFLFLRMR